MTLSGSIPASLANIRGTISRYQWGRDLVHVLTDSMQGQHAAATAKTFATRTVNAITDAVIIVALGVFLGANPPLYRSGLLRLLPAPHRARADRVFTAMGVAMRNWLLGQLIPMAALGIGTTLGLWFLSIPLAFTLGLFTAFMLFIPYVGSVLAFIPTVLVAFTVSPRSALYVAILYLGVHAAEGYVITPLAQRWMVKLPPALTLFSQLFMWTTAGLLGVFVATPLAAAAMVATRELHQREDESQPVKVSALATPLDR